MAIAVSLLFDPEVDGAVRRVWQALADSGICSAMDNLGYAPHVSLIVSDDDDLATSLSNAIDAMAGERGLDLSLGLPGNFPIRASSGLPATAGQRFSTCRSGSPTSCRWIVSVPIIVLASGRPMSRLKWQAMPQRACGSQTSFGRKFGKHVPCDWSWPSSCRSDRSQAWILPINFQGGRRGRWIWLWGCWRRVR